MFIRFDSGASSNSGNPVAKIVAFVVSVLALALALMFSFFFFAALALAGGAAWLYLLWKTRAIRKHLREQAEAQNTVFENGKWPSERRDSGGRVIEGEVVKVPDSEPPE